MADAPLKPWQRALQIRAQAEADWIADGRRSLFEIACRAEAQRQREQGTFEAWCAWTGFDPALFAP